MAATRDIVTPSGVTLRVSARTGLRGLDQRTINAIQAMAQAAPAAGISVIDITAGKEGGHLSHGGGTEVDLKGYTADGTLWTPEQRVAIAAGAQQAGANRFGLYSYGKGSLGRGSLHMGFSGVGRPAAVWGAGGKVRGDASRRFSNPAEKAFLASYQAGNVVDTASLGLPALAPQAPQTAQSALASLQPPEGGTQTASPPSPLQGFQPTIPDAAFGTPGQQAITEMLRPPTQLPPQWDPATGFPEHPRGPGPGGALGVDLGQQPAGMPAPPSRPGTFDWLGGGAPDAGLVPTPGVSPLRPAMGGPGDRRPQPPNPAPRPWQGPMPQGRPGNFDWTGGGAPGAPPDPRMRPSAPQSPVEAFSAPAGPLDLIPYSTQPRATPAPPIPGPDRSILAGGNFGTPETAMSIERTFSPPSPLAGIDQRMDRAFSDAQSRGLARELGFNRRQMERYTAPPPAPFAEARMKDDVFSPSSGPYFSNADPGPTFTPPSDLPGRFEDAFAPGPTFTPPPPALPAPMAYSELPPISGGAGADALDPLSPPPPPPPISMADFGGRFDPAPPPISRDDFNERWGPTQPTAATGEDIILPGTVPGAGSILPPDEPLIPSPNPIDIAIGDAGLGTPRQLRRTDPNRPSFLQRAAAQVFSPLFGPGGGGFIGPNGFFSNAGSFTPFGGPGAGGSSPFNQQPGGAMGTTNWRHGSVTGNPNMQGTMWNRSGDNGSVGYVTDPFTGSMIYSGSPNRL